MVVTIAGSDEIVAAGEFLGPALSVGAASISSVDANTPQPFLVSFRGDGAVRYLMKLAQPRPGSDTSIIALGGDPSGGLFVALVSSDSLEVGGQTLGFGAVLSAGPLAELNWASTVPGFPTDLDHRDGRTFIAAGGFESGSVVELDSVGSVLRVVSTSGGITLSVATHSSGAVFFGGSARGEVEVGRLDSNLSEVWRMVSQSNASGWISDMAVGPDQSVYFTGLAGSVQFSGSQDSTDNGVFVGRFGQSGTLSWLRSVTGVVSSRSPEISSLEEDGIVIAAPFFEFDGASQDGVLIREYSPTGGVVGSFVVEHASVNVHSRHYFDADQEQYVLAASELSGPGSLGCATKLIDDDVSLMVIDRLCALSTGAESVDTRGHGLEILSAFPNPAKSRVELIIKTSQPSLSVTITVTDLLGRKVYSHRVPDEEPGEHHVSIDLNSLVLPAGVYVLQVHSADARGDALPLVIVR